MTDSDLTATVTYNEELHLLDLHITDARGQAQTIHMPRKKAVDFLVELVGVITKLYSKVI